MAVVWGDLAAPSGKIDAALLFGDTDAGEERLTAYITDGETVGADLTGDELDEFVTHHAYYRAYLAKYELELTKAAQRALVDQGSTAKLEVQITGWLDLANAEKALADELLPPDTVTPVGVPTTTSTPILYVW